MSSIFGLDVNDKRVVGQDGISATDSIIAAERIVALNLSQLTAVATTIADDDLYVMQTANGAVKKITGAILKSIFMNIPSSSLWSNIGTGTSLQTANSYTYIDLDTNSTYNLLNTDIRVIPSSLSEGQLIKYDSGLGGGNGGMIFGSNSTSSVSGWETAIHAKQFIKFKCATTDIAEFSVNPSGVKLIELKGDTTINGDIVIPNNGNIDFFEATSSGTNRVRLRCNTSLASDYTITLPLSSGVLFGTSDIIPRQNGGTGLTTIGLAGQVLSVNSGRTALEYTTPTGSNFQLDASGNLSPVVIGNDLLVGTRNNTQNAKFVVDGTSRMSQIYCTYLESSSNIVCDIALPNNIRLMNNGQMRFYEATGNGSSYIGLKGASSLGVNYDISLPSASGTLALTSQIGSSFWTAYSSIGTYTTGNVGIRNSTPNVPLAVGVQANGGGNFTSGFYSRSNAQGGGFASNNGFSAWNPYPISIVAEGGGYFKTGYLVASDRRIKTNIEDVIDTDSLTKLRQIPCRNYKYIDKISRGNEKTIGFIAQEVEEVYPNAVSLEEEIIPDIYKNIDCVWNVDGDKFKMSSTDLNDVSGGEYLFYCRNTDDDDEGEDKIGIVANDDNTFTFDKKYDTVFCYGKSVKDFHRLEPDKLFMLNFSATQEIDKIQQTHITKIELLETELESVKTELDIYKSIIDKLMNATTFANFKKSL